MHKQRLIVTAILSGVWMLAAQVAMAEPKTPMTTCPSVDMLMSFDGSYIESTPIAFDAQARTVTLSVSQRRTFNEHDTMFQGYGTMVFIMSGIVSHEHEFDYGDEAVPGLLTQMQADFETPVMYEIDKGVQIPVCSYSLPGEAVKALVFQAPEEDTENAR